LTYKSERFAAPAEIIQDVLVEDLLMAGVNAEKVGAPDGDATPEALSLLARSQGVDYALGGEIRRFGVERKMTANHKLVFVETITLAMTLVSASGRVVFANELFAHNSERKFGAWKSDEFMDTVLKDVVRQIGGRIAEASPSSHGMQQVAGHTTAGKGPAPQHSSPREPRKATVSSGTAWAVVVGLSTFEHAGKGGLTDLVFAADDARSFAQSLLKQGWAKDHIAMALNEEATERNIRILLESWLTKAAQDDLIVLYWAGHGFPDPEDPEKVYLACHDTDVRIPATGFRMDRIISILRERNARNVIVIADTCHAGKLITRGERGLSVVPSVKRMRERDEVPKGWVFMVSAEADRQAIEHSSWRNGAFTHCLLQGLGGKADGYQSAGPRDGTVTLGELRAYLTTTMPEETQKVLGVAKRPLITTSTGDPNIWGLSLQPD